MHLILTGATGLVGSAALRAMINRDSVTKISVISRRDVPQAAGCPKVQVLLHKDFEKYDSELIEKVKDANGVVWALGISQNVVAKE